MIARVFSAAGNAAPRAPVRNLGACTSFSRFRCAPLAEWREVNSLPLHCCIPADLSQPEQLSLLQPCMQLRPQRSQSLKDDGTAQMS
eukprot:COSAG06_NODE_4657_length_4061_cov_1.164816_3_plen_87_part_00